MPSTPRDQRTRDRIERELGRTFLVEAGAGSGKTHSLARRIAAGIANGTYRIEQVAAVTFTRKAAAELRGRLQLALEDRLKGRPSSAERDRIERRALHHRTILRRHDSQLLRPPAPRAPGRSAGCPGIRGSRRCRRSTAAQAGVAGFRDPGSRKRVDVDRRSASRPDQAGRPRSGVQHRVRPRRSGVPAGRRRAA